MIEFARLDAGDKLHCDIRACEHVLYAQTGTDRLPSPIGVLHGDDLRRKNIKSPVRHERGYTYTQEHQHGRPACVQARLSFMYVPSVLLRAATPKTRSQLTIAHHHTYIYAYMHMYVCCMALCAYHVCMVTRQLRFPCVHGYSSVHLMDDSRCQHTASAHDYVLQCCAVVSAARPSSTTT